MFFKSTQLQQALGTDTKDKRLTDMHELKSKIKKKKDMHTKRINS